MGNETDIDGTKSLSRVPVAISLYSLTYTLEDNVMPTREEDFAELTRVTRTVFSDYMDRYFADYPLTIQTGFSTEFVRTGTTVENKLFVVFQSTVYFDDSSFMIPEASQVEAVLQEGLAKDDLLWMEYIVALQEMDEKNAFASTINVAYADTPPPEPGPRTSVGDSTSAVAAIAAAVAGVTVIAIGLFVMKRKRYAASSLDDGLSPEKRMRPTRSLFRTDDRDDSDTASNTYGESSFGLQTVPLTSTVGSTADVDEEIGSVGNDSTVYTSGEQSTKADDWQRYKAYSYDKDDSDDDCSEYSDDAIASRPSESSEGKALINESGSRTLKPWDAPEDTGEKSTLLCEGELTERQRGGVSFVRSSGLDEDEMRQKEEQMSQVRLELEAHRRSQKESQRLEQEKLAIERAALEEWLRKEKIARLDEEKRLSEEKLQAELAKIKAEKACVAAQKLRQKEEKRFVAEKKAFQTKVEQQEKARHYEERKLAKAKREFEAMIQREKQERQELELRLLREKNAADEALRKAEKRAQRAEERIKKERRKLKEAKEAMEAKQKLNEEVGGTTVFLKEEEAYLRQLRNAEEAREENLQASKEAARAVDIHKLQQMRFEEKEKDLNRLRQKEAKAAESAESVVKASLSPKESRIWDQEREMSQVPTPSISENSACSGNRSKKENNDGRLEIALRLAQSWGDSPAAFSGGQDQEVFVCQVRSWDSALLPKPPGYDSESDGESINQCNEDDDQNDESDRGECSDKEGNPGDDDTEKTTSALSSSGADASVADNDLEETKNVKHVAQCGMKSQFAVTSFDSSLPESVRRAAKKLQKDDELVLPKIGAAQFIAPWKDDDNIDEKRRKGSKSRKSRHSQSARTRSRANIGCDESMFSESDASSQNDGNTTVTSESVDDGDTCSEFSLRTSTTFSSGISKILPR
jgi:hypothetical protein